MFPSLGPGEMLVVMLVAVLLFGKRLPEVGRSLGKGIVEFKKGIQGVEDDFDAPASTSLPSHRGEPATTTAEPTVPKFEPPTSAPTIEPATTTATEPYTD